MGSGGGVKRSGSRVESGSGVEWRFGGDQIVELGFWRLEDLLALVVSSDDVESGAGFLLEQGLPTDCHRFATFRVTYHAAFFFPWLEKLQVLDGGLVACEFVLRLERVAQIVDEAAAVHPACYQGVSVAVQSDAV
jgi:hypothetical protein